MIALSKIVYGSRIMTILYVSRRGISAAKYLFYTTILNFAIVYLILTAGWFAGRGINKYVNIIDNVNMAVLVFVLLAVFLYVMKIIAQKVYKEVM